MPPTRMTSSISEALSPASLSAARHGSIVRWIRSSTSCFELRARQLDVEMLRPGLVGRDERQVDVGLHRRGQLDLGLLGRLLQALQGELVVAQVDALLLLELVGEIVDDLLVEVLAAEEGVAVGRLDLEHAVADLEDRDVEGAAAEVVDRDRAGALLLHAVGERRRGRLVDDAQHFEPGDAAGVLGRLALRVVEIGRDGDDRLVDRLAEIGLGGFLHLLQDEGADLRGRVFLAAALDPGVAVVAGDDLVRDEIHVLLDHRIVHAAPDQPLDREERVLGIGHRLPLRRLADEPLAGFGERDHRGRRARALGVLDDLGVPAFHHGDARIRGAEIDADDFAHGYLFSKAGPVGPGKHRPDPPETRRRNRTAARLIYAAAPAPTTGAEHGSGLLSHPLRRHLGASPRDRFGQLSHRYSSVLRALVPASAEGRLRASWPTPTAAGPTRSRCGRERSTASCSGPATSGRCCRDLDAVRQRRAVCRPVHGDRVSARARNLGHPGR